MTIALSLLLHIQTRMFTQIYNNNQVSQFTVSCAWITDFIAAHFLLDNQWEGSSLDKTSSYSLSSRQEKKEFDQV